jgi:type IV pilus assembly protein PilO
MDKLIERIAKASVGAKLAAVGGALVLVSVLNYFVMGLPFGPSVSEIEKRITRTNAEQRQLDSEFIEKTAIANDLNRFRRERELLEQKLTAALAELPEEKNLDELLQVFQDRAQKAGLEIVSIEPKSQVSAGFYARIPIQMKVEGNFHEIATFFDSVGRLRRIVNVSEISLESPKDVSGKMIVAGQFLATTFMFVEGAKAPKRNP